MVRKLLSLISFEQQREVCSKRKWKDKSSDEIYLGGIWGLFTHSIPFWEEHKEDKYGCNGFGIDENLSLYEMIVDQYRTLLSSNIRAMFNKARNNYPYYKSLGY